MTTRARAVGAAAVAIAAGLAACTPDEPSPGPTAQALAEGLASGELDGVLLAGAPLDAAEAAVVAAYTPLGELRPAVDVSAVTVAEDGASAGTTLSFQWDVGGTEPWSYTTDARLLLEEDAWAVDWSTVELMPELAAGETVTVRRIPAERGQVLGAGGVPIVEERPVLRLGLDKTLVDPAAQADSAEAVATVLGLDPADYVTRTAAAGERAFVEALVVRAGNPGVDLEAFRAVPGARALEDTLPLAPSRRFARPLLGTAGPATAEVVEESGGEVVAGDVAGLSGLQRQYDEQLRGEPGVSVLAVSDAGRERELFASPPVAGQPLQTTLDPRLQELAETVLADVGPASALVALRPSTGEVLAAASGPGSGGLSTATTGTYAPGSVFKLVSALALLRAGLTPDSTLECPPTIDVEGRTFSNFPDYPASATGTVPLRTALAHSCNTAMIGGRELIQPAALADAAASLGLGVEADLGFPWASGTVPVDLSGTDFAASMIGQGRVQASPLAMAAVAASIGRGATVTPWLVGAEPPAPADPAVPLTDAEAEHLRTLMRAVVTEGGATFLADAPGEPVLAKTGTAQYGDGTTNHAWMVAVQGELAVTVFVETGEYGGTTAGPLLEDYLRSISG